MTRAAWLPLLALLLAGCAGWGGGTDPSPPGRAAEPSPCAFTASFRDAGLFRALPDAAAGAFEAEQWAPGLPYENATLRERWGNYSLFVVGRTFGQVGDVPTNVNVRPRGAHAEVIGSAEANVTDAEVRDAFLAFARSAFDAPEETLAGLADSFLASRSPSAWREGTPGNATPGGEGPFREYEPGPVYGYGFNVTTDAPLRLQALLDAMPPLEAWTRVDAETGRMLYERDGWSLWFEQPRHHLQAGDVRVTAFPTGEAFVHVAREGLAPAQAAALVDDAFADAGLRPPGLVPGAFHGLPCGH
ncbi:MAG TPA: hypothetical protein VNX21_02430 [Candidatus Thermoplasmatota archaeon]|nr:hypothetical protein [Candidatus Thermoplasmatota archaeon]